MRSTHHRCYAGAMRVLVLAALMASCEIDDPPDRLGPSRYEYCAEYANRLEGGFSELAFRVCLEGPGARAAEDGGAD